MRSRCPSGTSLASASAPAGARRDLTLDDPAVDVTAESEGLRASLSLQQSAGTLELEGRSWPALAVARSFMGGAVLHETFVRAEDRFYLLWVYCVDGHVTSI